MLDWFNWISKGGIELNNVQRFQLIDSQSFCDDFSNFMWMETIIYSCSGGWNVTWVKRINVERDVDWQLWILSQEINSLLRCVVSDVVLFYCFSLEIVYVADSNIYQFIKRKFFQTKSWCPVSFFKTSTHRKRCAMFVTTYCGCISMNVGMCINPNHVQISKFLKWS